MCHTTFQQYTCSHNTENVRHCADPEAFAHLCSRRTTRIPTPCPACTDRPGQIVSAVNARSQLFSDYLEPLAEQIQLVLTFSEDLDTAAPEITTEHLNMLNLIYSRIQSRLKDANRRRDTANDMLTERGEYLTMLSMNFLEPQSSQRDSRANYLVDMIEIVDESLESMAETMRLEMSPEDLTELCARRCELDFCRDTVCEAALAGLTQNVLDFADEFDNIQDFDSEWPDFEQDMQATEELDLHDLARYLRQQREQRERQNQNRE